MRGSVDGDAVGAPLDDARRRLRGAELSPFPFVPEDDVRPDRVERPADVLAEAFEMRPRRQVDADGCALRAGQFRPARRRAGDRLAHQGVAGEMERVTGEP
jgi:hypothetical protein